MNSFSGRTLFLYSFLGWGHVRVLISVTDLTILLVARNAYLNRKRKLLMRYEEKGPQRSAVFFCSDLPLRRISSLRCAS